jgi:hypothetical protein
MKLQSPDNKRQDGMSEQYQSVRVHRTIVGDQQGVIADDYVGVGELRKAYYGKQRVFHGTIADIGGIKWKMPTIWWRTIMKYNYSPSVKVLTEYHEDSGETITYTYEGISFNGPQDISFDYFANHLGILDTDGHRQCMVEALLKLNKGAVNYGQLVAESRQTASLLASTGSDLLKLLRAVKHGKLGEIPRDFGTIVDKVGNRYLEWRYGWRPLASDIHGMFYNAKEKLNPPQILSGMKTINSNFGDTFMHHQHKVTASYKHRDQCKLWAKVDDPAYFTAQNYGLANPLSLGWEVIPYSFVVDWFVPVGNFLECLTAANGLSFVAGFVNQKRELTAKVDGDPGSLDIKGMKFERVPLSGFPSASLYANQSPFNTTRILDMLALLNQLR